MKPLILQMGFILMHVHLYQEFSEAFSMLVT